MCTRRVRSCLSFYCVSLVIVKWLYESARVQEMIYMYIRMYLRMYICIIYIYIYRQIIIIRSTEYVQLYMFIKVPEWKPLPCVFSSSYKGQNMFSPHVNNTSARTFQTLPFFSLVYMFVYMWLVYRHFLYLRFLHPNALFHAYTLDR